MPKEVEKECCGVKQSLDALLIQKAIEEKRIRVAVVKDRKLYDRIRHDFPLGKGEAEAIALAVSEKAAVVAIDDKHAINACKLLRIPFTTAVAVLITMCAALTLVPAILGFAGRNIDRFGLPHRQEKPGEIQRSSLVRGQAAPITRRAG